MRREHSQALLSGVLADLNLPTAGRFSSTKLAASPRREGPNYLPELPYLFRERLH